VADPVLLPGTELGEELVPAVDCPDGVFLVSKRLLDCVVCPGVFESAAVPRVRTLPVAEELLLLPELPWLVLAVVFF
jgi:hypothetical protein